MKPLKIKEKNYGKYVLNYSLPWFITASQGTLLVIADKPWPKVCDAILICLYRSTGNLQLWEFFLYPLALKQHSCYHMWREKEEIVSSPM